jgi:hypothetical protein
MHPDSQTPVLPNVLTRIAFVELGWVAAKPMLSFGSTPFQFMDAGGRTERTVRETDRIRQDENRENQQVGGDPHRGGEVAAKSDFGRDN